MRPLCNLMSLCVLLWPPGMSCHCTLGAILGRWQLPRRFTAVACFLQLWRVTLTVALTEVPKYWKWLWQPFPDRYNSITFVSHFLKINFICGTTYFFLDSCCFNQHFVESFYVIKLKDRKKWEESGKLSKYEKIF